MKTKKRRTREELVKETFRLMIRQGDAVKQTVTIGMTEKTYYKVLPNRRLE